MVIEFVSVEPGGSPIVLSIQDPATSLRLVTSDDDVCTGAKVYILSFSDSSTRSSSYFAVADEGRRSVTVSVTDGMNVRIQLLHLVAPTLTSQTPQIIF